MKTALPVIIILLLTCNLAFTQDITAIQDYDGTLVKVIKFDISNQWINTGVTLKKDSLVLINVEGVASCNGLTKQNSIYWLGPEGMYVQAAGPNSPMPGAPPFSVVGKIGSSGKPFYIGRHILFKPKLSGYLYVGINDEIVWEDDGYFIVYVFAPLTITGASFKTGQNLPDRPQLSQNYPNPFNPTTTIEYILPHRSNVQVTIYNTVGQMIRTLVNEQNEPGNYSVDWDGLSDSKTRVSSGTYYYQVKVGDFAEAKKMILLK